MPFFVCWGLEIAILCMWGSRECHFWYVGESKMPFLCEGLENAIFGMRGLENAIFLINESLEKKSSPLPYPFLIGIALTHNLEISPFYEFLFYSLLVHSICFFYHLCVF